MNYAEPDHEVEDDREGVAEDEWSDWTYAKNVFLKRDKSRVGMVHNYIKYLILTRKDTQSLTDISSPKWVPY